MMKYYFRIIFLLGMCCGSLGIINGAFAQPVPAKIFEAYKKDPSLSVLPDFSYAGYHHGEKDTPKTPYKVFNITDFGAVPDDTISDRKAIEEAIKAVTAHGSGTVFFPKGRFLVSEDNDARKSIIIPAGHIILKGSGSGKGGTELFMKNTLEEKSPSMFLFTNPNENEKIARIDQKAKEADFTIRVENSARLKPGDWVMLHLESDDSDLVRYELGTHQPDSAWSLTSKGVFIRVFHQVKHIGKNNNITLIQPLAYPVDPKHNWEVHKFSHREETGIEDIAFIGNWKEKFVHHASWIHNFGWSMVRMERLTNSWIKNCRFTDVNVAAAIALSANVSVINCSITGNKGHEAIVSTGSTNVFMGKITDEAAMSHSIGVASSSMNTVIWKAKYPSTTSFECHSSQPRNTLLDGVEGGLLNNRGGGALVNMPNHMRNLVMWNFKKTNHEHPHFEFWPKKPWYWRIPDPVIVGFHGSKTTFNPEELKYSESIGQPVTPESLYEAQLKMRLGKVPNWLSNLNNYR